jgi:chorismate-pyruvate lyase
MTCPQSRGSCFERILLSTQGTVQTLLGVIFGYPVSVEVISQLNYDTVLVRWVRLYAEDPDPFTIALAQSVIPYDTNRVDFIGKMSDKELGIGQVLQVLDITTNREILGVHVDERTIARSYKIIGDEINILITESFPREIFNGRHNSTI